MWALSANRSDFRGALAAELADLLPKGWKWFDYTTALDAISSPTAILTLKSIEPLAEAPKTHRLATYTLTLVDPSGNPETREDSLDDEIVDLLGAIDEVRNLVWTTAERVIVGSAGLGYDVTITRPFFKTTTKPKGA